MAVNPKKPAQVTINGDKAIVKCDEDQLSLSALTGIALATDADSGVPTSIKELQAHGAVVRVIVRYLVGLKTKSSPIYMTVEKLGLGSVAKLIGKSYKGSVIRSAKLPQRSVVY